MEWKWNGNGMEMEWKWNGNGMEMKWNAMQCNYTTNPGDTYLVDLQVSYQG
jgi:hypothetical protein